MERMTRRGSDGTAYAINVGYYNTIERLAEYEEAEEQGLILRLPAPLDDVESFEIADKGIWMKIPCRKGDTVYEIDGITWKGYDWKYKSYENAFVKETVFRLEMLSEIGKTVFLTKEEAEQKVREAYKKHDTGYDEYRPVYIKAKEEEPSWFADCPDVLEVFG